VAIDMDPLSLLCRLAASVPAPNFHVIRYAGVLASAHQFREARRSSRAACCVASSQSSTASRVGRRRCSLPEPVRRVALPLIAPSAADGVCAQVAPAPANGLSPRAPCSFGRPALGSAAHVALARLGYRILRLDAKLVLENIDETVTRIRAALAG